MINRRVQKTAGSKHLYSLAKRDYNAGHQPLRRWDNNAAWILIPWIYSHDLRFEIIDRRKPRWNETEWNIGQWPFKGEEGVVQGGYSISSRLAQHLIRNDLRTRKPSAALGRVINQIPILIIGSRRTIINSQTRIWSRDTSFVEDDVVSCAFNFRFSRRYASRDLDPLVSHLFKNI